MHGCRLEQNHMRDNRGKFPSDEVIGDRHLATP